MTTLTMPSDIFVLNQYLNAMPIVQNFTHSIFYNQHHTSTAPILHLCDQLKTRFSGGVLTFSAAMAYCITDRSVRYVDDFLLSQ